MEIKETKKTLLDTIHKCIMCNKLAYEVGDNEYKCSNSDCKYTWKVIDRG